LPPAFKNVLLLLSKKYLMQLLRECIKPITRWIAKYNEHARKSSEIFVLTVGGFAAIANLRGMKLF